MVATNTFHGGKGTGQDSFKSASKTESIEEEEEVSVCFRQPLCHILIIQ